MIDQLLELAKTLRGPEGCPWDKKRELEDIPALLLEETEEIQQAIANKDWENLKEEIGDVLFNLCLLMQIAEEQKLFTSEEVTKACYDKIVERHTWVFGDDKATTPEEALTLWKKNKQNQKNKKRQEQIIDKQKLSP